MIDADYFEPRSVTEHSLPDDYKGLEKPSLDESDATAVENYPDIEINLSELSYSNKFTKRGYFVIFNYQHYSEKSKYYGYEIGKALFHAIL